MCLRPRQNIKSSTMVCHTMRRQEKQVNMASVVVEDQDTANFNSERSTEGTRSHTKASAECCRLLHITQSRTRHQSHQNTRPPAAGNLGAWPLSMTNGSAYESTCEKLSLWCPLLALLNPAHVAATFNKTPCQTQDSGAPCMCCDRRTMR